jgi:hypothetical protein
MLRRYSEGRQFGESLAHAKDEATTLACEYANCKNPAYLFGNGAQPAVRGNVLMKTGTPMSDDPKRPETRTAPSGKQLTPAAQRALAEAEARRLKADRDAKPVQKEYQGPKGPEPTRYGDWENKGIASDF